MNYCRGLTSNYTVDITKPVKLATAVDAITFLRGTALTHAFTEDLSVNLPTATASMRDISALGFVPSRIQTDMRMTTAFAVQNTSAMQYATITYYRVYAKSYCTGCAPIAELGRGTCNLTMQFNATSNRLVVTSSHVLGSQHDLGLMFARDVYSSLASILKYIAIFIAVGGYLASRQTIQWSDTNLEKVETIWNRLAKVVAPQYFPHRSHAIRGDVFCYNSDYFVALYVVSILLDMNHALVFTREVNVFNQYSNQFTMTIQLFALSTRMLWLNLGIVKAFKVLLHLVSPSVYSGESRAMPFFNFSSVTTLYLTTILLFYVPEYIEYNNQSRVDVTNKMEALDGQFVDFFESFYIRVAPAIAVGLLVNVVAVLFVDHLMFYPHWQKLKKNSLSRQAIFNSTSIVCEFVDDVQTVNGDTLMTCSARRMSTLQWYFMHHLRCFGLQERDLSKRKSSRMTIKASEQSKSQLITTTSPDLKYTVGQDNNGHIHLLDDQLSDVKSLVLNIKVLRDTSLVIQ
ncbi:hypothetical protein DYB32_009660 [Aphanomyces invadans]|uniref:Uncharacterized protein n=1 Tax=Aphanomyces invadans TaxID=157072 RepID=A0A418AI28_9STRA|nr:hypothetical protein DYB32_009660 [Aphanomyces invadans]